MGDRSVRTLQVGCLQRAIAISISSIMVTRLGMLKRLQTAHRARSNTPNRNVGLSICLDTARDSGIRCNSTPAADGLEQACRPFHQGRRGTNSQVLREGHELVLVRWRPEIASLAGGCYAGLEFPGMRLLKTGTTIITTTTKHVGRGPTH